LNTESNYQAQVMKTVANLAELSSMKNISADPRSLYSQSLDGVNYILDLAVDKSIRGNPDALIIHLLLVAAVNPEWKSLFIAYCGDQCYRFNYQGKWRILHKLCTLQSIMLMLQLVIEQYSPREFFGNLLPKLKKAAQENHVRFIKQAKPRGNYPKKKSGYNDKGSMKFPHEIHSAWRHTGPNPEKLDLRSQYKRKQAILNFLYH